MLLGRARLRAKTDVLGDALLQSLLQGQKKVKAASASSVESLEADDSIAAIDDGDTLADSPMDEVCSSLLATLSLDSTRRLQRAIEKLASLSGGDIRLSSACSGTDLVTITLRRLRKAMRAHGMAGATAFRLRHVFSCEVVPWKRLFIILNYGFLVFRDIKELWTGVATDHDEKPTDVPEDDWHWVGFSCKSRSKLFRGRQFFEGCIAKEEGTTGETFGGVVRYVAWARPAMVSLENVCSLGTQNRQEVLKALRIGSREAKYVCSHVCIVLNIICCLALFYSIIILITIIFFVEI